MNYSGFIAKKELLFHPVGFEPEIPINEMLYPFQKDIVRWALRKGRACLFEDCGLGKTPQQLEWANHINKKYKKSGLIVAPLAVAQQTKEEGEKFSIKVNICESQKNIKRNEINITNYEKLHKFDGVAFNWVVLDESSILKSFSGKIRNQIIEMFQHVPYRLACTATPSPNDYMELGNHAEFLGIMTYSEMLSMFFVNDSGDVGKWRLKKHANENDFWRWMASWSIMITNPKDLEYEQEGFDLPPLNYIEHILPMKQTKAKNGFFNLPANTMDERRKVRNETIQERCERAAKIVNQTKDQWVLWCGLNEESRILNKLIDNSIEIAGSTPYDNRVEYMLGFKKGKVKRLITKPSIAGFGMNWQNCNNMVFVGLNDSWEQLYQATRRLWRFGQTKPVNAHIIIEEREGKVLDNIKRKDKQAKHMAKSIIGHTKDITKMELSGEKKIEIREKIEMEIPKWI